MSSRIASIPIDHIVAELAAFPLASEASLELSLTELSPQLNGNTERLWRSAEKHLLGSSPAFSVDETVAIRDFLWFPLASVPHIRDVPLHQYLRDVPLHQYLARLAHEHLEIQGSVVTPRLPERSPENPGFPRYRHPLHKPRARRAWWWLTAALPPESAAGRALRRRVGP